MVKVRSLSAIVGAVLALSLGAGCNTSDSSCDAVEPGILCTLAGNGENGYDPGADFEDLPTTEARLSLPMDTLSRADGSVLVVDWNNHRIRSVHDGVISWVAGTGRFGAEPDVPVGSNFIHPSNIIFDQTGEKLIVAAWQNSEVRELDLATGTITTIAGDGRRGYFGDGGPATRASFDFPSALAYDPDGNLVVMDQTNQVLRAIDSSGIIHRRAGQCVVDFAEPIGPGSCEQPVQCPDGPNGPSGKYICGGDLTLCNAPCAPGYSGDEIDSNDMRMSQPFGDGLLPGGRILYDPAGSLYFTDTTNHLIRKIDAEGRVHRVAGQPPVDGVPQNGYAGDGGDALDALLNFPVDLALDDDGTLYVADAFNSCVRAIDPDNIITTVVGTCGVEGADERTVRADQALLFRPFGIEWYDGRLIVSDTGNNVIRVVRLP
jgi:DNA-binding beta-propeller fold protein YncE